MSPVDMAMLDLFRMEAQTHGASLRQGLDAFPSLPENERGRVCKTMARSAQSLKGAARIIGLDGPAGLAQAMESLFLRNDGTGPDRICAKAMSDILPLLGQCVDIFLALADLDGQEYDGWLANMADAMDDLTVRIRDWQPQAGEPHGADTPETATPIPPTETAPPAPTYPAGPATPLFAEKTKTSEKPASVPLNIADASLLDLFVIEAQTHGQSLDSGLVALEKDQRPEMVEPLMRAAHSLKGAARIVGLDNVVVLAHAMEDVLEACRKGELNLTTGHIDLLLKANDLFLAMGEARADDLPTLLNAQAEESGALAQAVRDSLHAAPTPVHTPAAAPAETEAPPETEPRPESAVSAPEGISRPDDEAGESKPFTPAQTPAPAPATPSQGDGVVRVSTQNLTRIMGLAGECLVEARSLFPFLHKLNTIRQETAGTGQNRGRIARHRGQPQNLRQRGTVRAETFADGRVETGFQDLPAVPVGKPGLHEPGTGQTGHVHVRSGHARKGGSNHPFHTPQPGPAYPGIRHVRPAHGTAFRQALQRGHRQPDAALCRRPARIPAHDP